MKFRIISIITCFLLIAINVFGHKEGHGTSTKVWLIDNQPLIADFVKYEENKVFLFDNNHELTTHELSAFTPKDQNWILEKSQIIVSKNEKIAESSFISSINYKKTLGYLLGIFTVLLSIFFLNRLNVKYRLTYFALGLSLIFITACSDDNTEPADVSLKAVPANDVSFLNSIFGNFSNVNTDSDDELFYIASNGLPAHNMMTGITNWQQQVPINQDYTGNNSWAIPMQPELAENPLSTETNLLKGAIAIAANGIPIFNPLNNRGEDANAIGELDQWGGHCGRADDYHYHMPPVHLQSIVGEGNPVAYAVDGFPIYGETTEELDEYLGRFNADSTYQYHTVQEYPYFIAGMRGKVILDPNTTAPENQVIPQAMTQELRPATEPLQGAVITDFTSNGTDSYSLTYTLNNQVYIINYSWNTDGLYTYEFVNPDGISTLEMYQR